MTEVLSCCKRITISNESLYQNKKKTTTAMNIIIQNSENKNFRPSAKWKCFLNNARAKPALIHRKQLLPRAVFFSQFFCVCTKYKENSRKNIKKYKQKKTNRTIETGIATLLSSQNAFMASNNVLWMEDTQNTQKPLLYGFCVYQKRSERMKKNAIQSSSSNNNNRKYTYTQNKTKMNQQTKRVKKMWKWVKSVQKFPLE